MKSLVVCVSLLAGAGCVADTGDEGFVLSGNLSPTDDCGVNVDRNGPFLTRGTIWLGSPNPYIGLPLIESRIDALQGQETQRTIALRGARIDITVESVQVEEGGSISTVFEDDLDPFPTEMVHYRSLFSAPLPPLGLASAGVDLVPPSLLDELARRFPSGNVRAQLVSTAVGFGDLSGDEIESLPFVYPVTACSDCIVNVVSACPAPASTVVRTGNSCNLFQDGIVDCCQNADSTLTCPATVVAM